MRRPPLPVFPLILACLVLAAGVSFFAQTAGGNRGNPGRPPTRGPESGLLGGKGPTTRPGSHESAAKDERDRVAGKFPPPKENSSTEEERRTAAGAVAGTVYVDAVALEAQRQALALTRDDFRVTIDGGPRKVVSLHYVFRGPQALVAGRSISLGNGVIGHADEARTIVVVVDETSFPAGAERALKPQIEHLLEVVGPVDRVAVLTLPQPGPLTFAGTANDLFASVGRVVGRQMSAGEASAPPLDALARVLRDLVKPDGPKSVILFSAAPGPTTRRVSGTADMQQAARVSAILDAAAASRSAVHVVIPTGPRVEERTESGYLQTLARSTGGTATRLDGQPHDLAPLAAALLGGYVLEVEGRAADRDGTAHALAVTALVDGVRVLAPVRWMPRFDPLPAPVMLARP